jgi:hypothetical protein
MPAPGRVAFYPAVQKQGNAIPRAPPFPAAERPFAAKFPTRRLPDSVATPFPRLVF